MKSIFTQSLHAEYWLEKSEIAFKIEPDFDVWRLSQNATAIIEVLDYDQMTFDLVRRCCNTGHITILFLPELITDEWCQAFDLPNVIFMLNGCLNWYPRHAQVETSMYFFWSTSDFYRTYPHLLNNLNGAKTHTFDVLLGRRKPHRDIIYNNIDHTQNIVTYFSTQEDRDLRNLKDTEFIWPSETLPRPKTPIEFTVGEVLVDGVIVSLSQVVPRDIYQKTCYTLVPETQYENSFSFFTEKITKPLLAKRLFVVASGQHYLHNLRKLGFQTFGDIIDESYDQEPDVAKRMNMVLTQVRNLQNMDYNTVIEQAKPALEHNYKLIAEKDWQNAMISRLAEIIA